MVLSKFKRRLKLKRHGFILSVIIFLIFYIFGVFTHLFELDLNHFINESNLELQLALQDLESTPSINLDKYYDINMLNFKFIHKSQLTCDVTQTSPFLVILVKSKYSNFEQRNSIRQTWASTNHKKLIRTIFMIGSSTYEFNHLIRDEAIKYGDIVQQDFIDTYYNNTLKTSMALKWINKYCSNSKYYLLIDDDFYLNPKLLMKYLMTKVDERMFSDMYAGFVFPKSSPMRHLTSKWYISLKDYPYSKFPAYVSAGCYILSQTSAKKFYLASKFNKLFKFDDIFMGILSMRLNIKPQHIEEIYYYAPTYTPSLYSRHVIASHGFTSTDLIRIWSQLNQLIQFNSI